MPTVFLSYRRNDTAAEAGRLADALQHRHGRRFVFRDVVGISPGDHFDAVLAAQLAGAETALVLVGPAWMEEMEKRLSQGTTDYHRVELATALRAGKRVIPVLIRGAVLPPPSALPDDLLAFSRCQAMTMRDETWKTDVDRLLDAIGHPYRWDLLALRILAAVVVIIVGVWKVAPEIVRDQGSDYAFWRWLVLALFGVYGLVEMFLGCRRRKTMRRPRQSAER